MKGKVYIAGKLCTESEREFLEKIDEVCKKLGLETFLPHRDVGLAANTKYINEVFKGDIIDGFKDVDIVVANLNGLHTGAGTAWELGYAYAKGIPAIGIKTDENPKKALEYLSAILLGSMKIVTSFEELEKELENLKEKLIKRSG